MVLKGLRAIGRHLGVSPNTILIWHREFDDPYYCFPLVPRSTGIGAGIRYLVTSELINIWLWRLSEKDVREYRLRVKHVRKAVVRLGRTRKRIANKEKLAG